MNEFSAKKLGEVLAFATIGLETAERGEKALTEAFGTDVIASYHEDLRLEQTLLASIADRLGGGEITLTKAEKTGEKLRAMRDGYIGDSWNDAAELMEWLGFFEGAAAVHWSLVVGVASSINDTELNDVSSKGLTDHQEFLKTVVEKIQAVGSTRSNS